MNDAHAVDDLLRNRFGFQTEVLLDATRTELLESLNEFRTKLGEKDNLLPGSYFLNSEFLFSKFGVQGPCLGLRYFDEEPVT